MATLSQTCFHHMHRYADSSRLIGYGTGYRLSYPPCGIGRKFIALCVIKFFSPIDTAMKSVFKDELNKALDTLPERERDVLKFRYGIGSDRAHTLEEVGREFKVTRERIRQMFL